MSENAGLRPSDVAITPSPQEPQGRRIRGFRMDALSAPGFAVYMESVGAVIHEVHFIVEKEDFPLWDMRSPLHYTIVGTRDQVEAVRAQDEGATRDAVEVEEDGEEGEQPVPATAIEDGFVPKTEEEFEAMIDAHLADVGA